MEFEQQDLNNTPVWLRIWREQRENIQILAIALVLALLIRTFAAEPRYIPSQSMLPTLQVGDRLVVEKISYYLRSPAAGDIVVFDTPPRLLEGYGRDQAFIKRIVAVAGQTVKIENGQVYLNGVPQQENYIAEPPKGTWGPLQVPDHQYFVMGDNRNNSNDSRYWGFLPREYIIGRAWLRFWPLDRLGPVGPGTAALQRKPSQG